MAPNAVKPIDPYPDALHADGRSLGLGLVAALHRLPARERAAITLTDVSGFERREVAEMLETTEAWVERTVRRARAAVRATAGPVPGRPPGSGSEAERRLIARLAAALERVDAAAVGELLAENVSLGCTRRWAVFRGRERVAAILCDRMTDERLSLVPTRANGQPAFGCYVADPHEPVARARGLLAITLAGNLVVGLTRFWDNDVLPYFGLPDVLPASAER